MTSDGLLARLTRLFRRPRAEPARPTFPERGPTFRATSRTPVAPPASLPPELADALAAGRLTQRTRHYRLAHVWLPRAAFADPSAFFDADPERVVAAIDAVLAEGLATEPVVDALTPFFIRIGRWEGPGWEATHVHLSPPVRATQVFGIALVRPTGAPGSVRYFTLELGNDRARGPCAFFCEWTAGRQHAILAGDLPPDAEQLRERVTAAMT